MICVAIIVVLIIIVIVYMYYKKKKDTTSGKEVSKSTETTFKENTAPTVNLIEVAKNITDKV